MLQSADQDLASRLRDGDAAAAELVTGWVRQAAAPFRSRLSAEWDDLVQQSVVELLEALASNRYGGHGSLRGYVWRSTCHTCLDRLRVQRRRVWLDIESFDLPASGRSAFERLREREGVHALLRVLERAPETCRELWGMLLEGLSYRQMSERVGVAEGTLRVRVLRCRQRALGELGNEPDAATP